MPEITQLKKRLSQLIQAKGWLIESERPLQNGYQYLINDGTTSVAVTLYPNGNMLIQGKESPLKDALMAWKTARPATRTHKTAPQATLFPVEATPVPAPRTGVARIGSDESGKGDYYGPLVVAAVAVDPKREEQLLALGVRDSKRLTDETILPMATRISEICAGQVCVERYMPATYNELYSRVGNLNTLLADVHVLLISRLQVATNYQLAVIDQFADRSVLKRAFVKTHCDISFDLRPRAEDDVAVAAASILARAGFVQGLRRLAAQYGLTFPKGSSDPRIVTVGRALVQREGPEVLKLVAKYHFKNTEEILRGSTNP
ncbi:ribonuclease HIII [Thermosporothrix hazakensis]|jgi:ribonuclease HIII|uniref:Ribonuclease n=1 Tax=Thermosporothrix hazakensis TaxID=644383 RepID=A0A326UT95_THEHA|nr:ribonuclease HIII [Thermosporothrix hazakensis]PZW35933.1 ribonuclease HIII [Thermosporothrix hazakensis]GCE46588.1 ribonuclease HIII [Thermosporothrix hazakensis]